MKAKKRFKVVERPPSHEFRLFDFQALDIIDEEDSQGKHFRIQMFGINEKGETCAIFLNDFKPFFYVKLPLNWQEHDVNMWFKEMKKKCRCNPNDILSVIIEKKEQLYEFTNKTKFSFAKISFNTMSAFNQFRKLMNDADNKFPTYESKIPPLLRYFHIHNISPSGWIQIKNCAEKVYGYTTCDYEFKCSQKEIEAIANKETPVPYKICSFDIEASSSHGDFPVPIKDYKRPSSQIVDCLLNRLAKTSMKKEELDLWLKKAILSIFEIGGTSGIDIVYPKQKVNKTDVKSKVSALLKEEIDFELDENTSKLLKITDMFSSIKDDMNNTENMETEMSNFQNEEITKRVFKKKKKEENNEKYYISEILLNNEFKREEKINQLNILLTKESSGLPKLEGDNVTFIGSTFMRYGDVEPYRNNCIVVGSCDEIPNSDITRVKNEKDCLISWSKLIQEENPDIIIGYNIFGFDYQFMFQRSKELDCIDEFCNLSRIQEELCYKKDYETNEKVLDHTQNRLASGDYDLHYPPISGRLQIDLLFYFRRDYNLSSYKLDDVAGTMIRDDIKGVICNNGKTFLYSKNLSGLHKDDFIHIEISSFTTDYYMNGKKFKVVDIERNVLVEDNVKIPNGKYNVIHIEGEYKDLDPKNKVLKWGMAKDDVSPQDIFRLSKESASSRSIVAKYCIQDCNLVHHLMKKVDVLTGYNEMARICNIPINFLVFRGQGIKLTSYVAKVCRDKNTLMPDLEKKDQDDGYEGAIVLPPKCAMYSDNPVACVDYSSLYPSIAKGWNLSPDSKVWTKTFDLEGKLIKINDITLNTKNKEKLEKCIERYDNLPNYKYIETTFDTYEYRQLYTANGKIGRKDKVKCGVKVCRWAQFTDGNEGIIPCIIGDLLSARKETRLKAESEPDPFIANVLDKRQLGYKVTANSLYGQMGSSVSTFFEKDVAASITAIGRGMIIYAKRMVEEIYGDSLYTAKSGRIVRTRSEYVYGDTDSVFFTFNLEDPDNGTPIKGKEALELTIEIAQETAKLCSLFLPPPMKLAYEKTLMSFILLSKKRYVGMLYEFDPNKGKLKFMGLPLKRRDSCDYLKDVYGGILTILMKEPNNVKGAIEYLNKCLNDLINGNVSMDKLALTKSLRSDYKNPNQIAHKVLADRIGEREPGNKPKPGDRIKYAFIENKNNAKLLGERIETPEFITNNKLRLDYHYYITNQLMNPLQQLFSLAIEQIYQYKNKSIKEQNDLSTKLYNLELESCNNLELFMKKREKYCSAEVKSLLFDPFLRDIYNKQNGIKTLLDFYKK
jgi:DNA polymerase elongation subunit (family B)